MKPVCSTAASYPSQISWAERFGPPVSADRSWPPSGDILSEQRIEQERRARCNNVGFELKARLFWSALPPAPKGAGTITTIENERST